MKHQELALEKQCREYARLNGWVACKLEKNAHKGIPDDLFISPDGVCIMVEFKRDANAFVRPEQVVWKAKFPSLIHFCHDFETFKDILSSAVK